MLPPICEQQLLVAPSAKPDRPAPIRIVSIGRPHPLWVTGIIQKMIDKAKTTTSQLDSSRFVLPSTSRRLKAAAVGINARRHRPVAALPHLQGNRRKVPGTATIRRLPPSEISAIPTGRGRTTNTRMNGHELDVVQLRPGQRAANDQLDTAGQIIWQMIDRAAGAAEEHSRHALETAKNFRMNCARPKIASPS